MGIRHALEADHLAAVTSMSSPGGGLKHGVVRGGAWGLGHTLTLLIVGATCLLMGFQVPDRLARTFDGVVGLMLIALGADVFRRMRRGRLHIHLHRHDDVVHLHAHRHDATRHADRHAHDHAHSQNFPLRAVAVGAVHGMAGSAALVLLTLRQSGSVWLGVGYIVIFGLGSMLGMATLSAVISMPLRVSARAFTRAAVHLEIAIGLLTIGAGLWVLAGGGWILNLP